MRFFFVFFISLVALVTTSCQASTDVEVSVNPNGTGQVGVQVTLDADAAKAVPNVAEMLRTSDLIQAGWTVDDPESLDDGGTRVGVHHPFSSPSEADGLLLQLTGPDGPFRNFHVAQQRSWFRSSTSFSGQVDLTKGIESFGDTELQARTGFPLVIDPAELREGTGVDLATTFPVRVIVDLPGDPSVAEPALDDEGGWSVPYGEITTLKTEQRGMNTSVLLASATGVSLLLAAAVLAKTWKSDAYRPAHRRKKNGVRARDLISS